jgi:hypothetical protein
MNACDDQSEPLGESPDIPGAPAAGSMLVQLAALDRQTMVLNEIRALHMTVPYKAPWSTLGSYDVCYHCRLKYPCPTIRILEQGGL